MTRRVTSVRVAWPVVGEVFVPVVMFLGVVVAGVVGFSTLAGVGPVRALFWVVDPGSVGLHFAAHDGPARATRLFAVLVQVGLVLTGLWIGESALTAVFGGRIQEGIKRVQNEREIERLDGHVVVCGFGMFGRTVAERLAETDRDVVVVERDESSFERLEQAGYLGVRGDARRAEVLADAGIRRADTVVAAIDDSNANIQTAIVAREAAPDVRVVVRTGDEMYESLARQAGADEVVIPEVTSARQVSDRV